MLIIPMKHESKKSTRAPRRGKALLLAGLTLSALGSYGTTTSATPACSILLTENSPFNQAALPTLRSAPGDQLQIVSTVNDDVEIENLNFAVTWPTKVAYDKYGRSIILVRNAKNVTIRNISIDMLDSDYRSTHGIFVENCDRLNIENVRVRGSIEGYSIRADDCKEVFINNVEVAGLSYEGGSVKNRGGGGIEVSYGRTGSTPSVRHVRISNCFIHDYHESDIFRNHDGINLESPFDAKISDCVIKNWGHDGSKYAAVGKQIDGAIDVSFRRVDDPPGRIVVEKNIMVNALRLKTPGEQSESETVIQQNVFIGTGAGFYHNSIVRFNSNTFLTDFNPGNIPFRLWNVKAAAEIHFESNIFAGRNVLNAAFYANSEGDVSKSNKVFASSNFFALPILPSSKWLDYSSFPDLTFDLWLQMPNITDSSDFNQGPGSCVGETSLQNLSMELCDDLHYPARILSACRIANTSIAPPLRLRTEP